MVSWDISSKVIGFQNGSSNFINSRLFLKPFGLFLLSIIWCAFVVIFGVFGTKISISNILEKTLRIRFFSYLPVGFLTHVIVLRFLSFIYVIQFYHNFFKNELFIFFRLFSRIHKIIPFCYGKCGNFLVCILKVLHYLQHIENYIRH